MGCKGCKKNKNLIDKVTKGQKSLFGIVGALFIMIPWIMGINQIIKIIISFISSLF